jgi:hypothetical protein
MTKASNKGSHPGGIRVFAAISHAWLFRRAVPDCPPMKPVRMAAMILITLLVIYPLSIGPAFLLDYEFHAKAQPADDPTAMEPSRASTICYYPILALMEKSPAAMQAVEWYVGLWRRTFLGK